MGGRIAPYWVANRRGDVYDFGCGNALDVMLSHTQPLEAAPPPLAPVALVAPPDLEPMRSNISTVRASLCCAELRSRERERT